MICKNCNQVFEGNFCNNCGQSADTHRLNVHFIWHDIQHGLFHFDKGIYYSVKELYLRPGHSIREFIEGKRINHFSPISLVIVLATVYGLLYHSFEINLFTTAKEMPKLNSDINNYWMAKHFSWLTLATIPLYTLGTYACFRNQGYNYIEYFILNTFKASQRLILHIVSFPILYHFNGTPAIKTFITVLYAMDIALIYWTNFQFFDRISTIKVLLLSALSHLIFLAALVFVLAIIVLFGGY
ncbi:hypothetical protein FNO01nite_33400 [Flavobacterium noncentrifugens]|uniref:DUF3667 domain-containing protein n=1 Tax=Flavobacterium noncentrifugens TaxID=1128970 RepID=A0A1G8Y585_9FLAO|nr:DUF3667 domain-containing protein [Flavobacterium noncentrifugens]GEP52668.1 hypothetical protein FNO01nite_33400 [Flavobacterium noncentrifugens]SDJ97998.1 Protein of unknown function [Flavobacterium noncentrifugens]